MIILTRIIHDSTTVVNNSPAGAHSIEAGTLLKSH